MNEFQNKILDKAFSGEWITGEELRLFAKYYREEEDRQFVYTPPTKLTQFIFKNTGKIGNKVAKKVAEFGRHGLFRGHLGEHGALKAGEKAKNQAFKQLRNSNPSLSPTEIAKQAEKKGAEATKEAMENMLKTQKEIGGTGGELMTGAFRGMTAAGGVAAGYHALKGDRQFKIVYLDQNGNVRTGNNKAKTKADSLKFFQATFHSPGLSAFKVFKTPEEDAQARDYEMQLRQSATRQFGSFGIVKRGFDFVKNAKPLAAIKDNAGTIKRLGAIGSIGGASGLALNAGFAKDIPNTVNDLSGKNIINVPGVAIEVYRVVFKDSRDSVRSTTVKSNSKANAIKALKSNPMTIGGSKFKAFVTPNESREASNYELQLRYN